VNAKPSLNPVSRKEIISSRGINKCYPVLLGFTEPKISANKPGKMGFEIWASIPASNVLSLSELVAFAVNAMSAGLTLSPYRCLRILVASYPYNSVAFKIGA